ncbi:MAG: hypothetical protein C5B53_04830 [Candidatus Melainabacteria bacterium]|nr:MAG: hypothetical protein C5B53_04830 [Candidatus Melainabacteria bacterium]
MAELKETVPLRTAPFAKEAKGKELDLVPFLVGFLAIAAFLPGLGSYKMLDPTDSFFVETGREMLVGHHYLTALFNYADWFDKPAFPFFLIVLSYKIFGVSEWAARLPSALSAIALTVYTYTSTAKILGRRTGFLAGVILVSCPLFSAVGHLALSDQPLTFFLGVALLGFAQTLVSEKRQPLLLAYLGLALAVLCKGPLGLVVSVGVVGTYLLVAYGITAQAVNKCRRLRLFTGLAILLIVCLPYYVLAHTATDGAFSREFFLHQNLGRFEGTVNHQQPVFWYVPIFLAGFFPWTIFVLGGVPWFKSLWKERRQEEMGQSFLLFCLVWITFVFFFFSAIPTKLPTYILSMSPAMAIVAAAYLDRLVIGGQRRSLAVSASLVLSVALIGLAVIACSRQSAYFLTQAITLSAVLAIVMLILPVVLSWAGRCGAAVWTLALAGYLGCSLLVPLSFQRFYEIHQAPVEKLIKLAKTRGATLATLFSTVPSAVFLYEKRIESLNSLAEVKDFSEKGRAPHYLLATSNCLKIPELKAAERLIDQAGKWYLLSVDHFGDKSPSSANPEKQLPMVTSDR